MPKIFINCPERTFSKQAKDGLAKELTTLALKVEKLPHSPFVKSTVWIYFNEYDTTNVYHGGSSAGTKVISVEVNVVKGTLDKNAKQSLIEEFTATICHHAETDVDSPPIFIVIRQVEPEDWGIFGKSVKLSDLYDPHLDKGPI